MDFTESIAINKDALLVLDPPYFGVDGLYGFKGELQKEFDHMRLYRMLRERDNWILFYNSCPQILSLYNRYRQVIPTWSYGMSNDKRSKEVLIINTAVNDAAVRALAA